MAGFIKRFYNLTHPVLGRILMLHRVVEQRSEKPEQRELEVTPQFLEQTITEHLKKGCRFVSIDEAVEILQKNHLSSFNFQHSTFICLTFDDGYQDNYTLAYPLLKRLNVPFAIYVTTGFIDKTAQMWWYDKTDVMSWEQIKDLSKDPLCTIGSHTVSHPKLSTLTKEDARKEILDSKQRLEEMLGTPINHFSYPHGDNKESILKVVKEAGFTTGLKAWGGPIRKGDVRLIELPRIEFRQP